MLVVVGQAHINLAEPQAMRLTGCQDNDYPLALPMRFTRQVPRDITPAAGNLIQCYRSVNSDQKIGNIILFLSNHVCRDYTVRHDTDTSCRDHSLTVNPTGNIKMQSEHGIDSLEDFPNDVYHYSG